jgi:RNA polymerase sigma-70 factor (ECF subfamily)
LEQLSDTGLFALLHEKRRIAEAAFQVLYYRHSPRIHAYCRCVFGDNELTNDVFQDTFMKFFEAGLQGREVANVPAYLLMIARNLCLNAKRNMKPTVSLDDVQLPSIDPSHEQHEMLQLIMMAMDLLDEDAREAFFLREFNDMSYAEIGALLGIREGNARVRVMRARSKVREILAPYMVEFSA